MCQNYTGYLEYVCSHEVCNLVEEKENRQIKKYLVNIVIECSEGKESLTETKTSGEGGPPTWLERCARRKVMPQLRPSDLKICDITVTTMKQEGCGEGLTLH